MDCSFIFKYRKWKTTIRALSMSITAALYYTVSGPCMAGTLSVCLPACLFLFVHVVPYCPLSPDETKICVYVCILVSLYPPSACVELTGAWTSRVASGPPSACTSSPFEALKKGRLGITNGPAEWHAPQLSLRPPASSPAALPPDTTSSVTAPFIRPHTTHFLSVTYPTYTHTHTHSHHEKSIKQLCSGGISFFGWYHPPCCAVNTGVFLLDDKDDNWQLDQL